DSVSEVRHGVSPVVDVCRERRVGAPNVEGRRSFQFRERRPFLYQHCGDVKFGGLVPTVSSMDGQGGSRECPGEGPPRLDVWLKRPVLWCSLGRTGREWTEGRLPTYCGRAGLCVRP